MATSPWSFGLTPEEEAYLSGQGGLLGQAAPTFGLPQEQPFVSAPPPDAPDYFAPPEAPPENPPLIIHTATLSNEPDDQAEPQAKSSIISPAKPLSYEANAPIVITGVRLSNEPDTADLGGIAAANTEAARREAAQPTVEVKGGDKAVYLQQLSSLINSPDHWKDTPEQMKALADQVAQDMGDPSLASKLPGNFGDIALYRKNGGTSPSPIPFQMIGKKPTKTAEEQRREIGVPLLVENTSTARMKAGFQEDNWAALQAAEEMLGIDASHADARRRYYNSVNQLIGPGVQPTEVSSFKDALTMAAQQAVEQEPYLAESVVGGGAGAIVKGSVGAALGAFGTSYAMELGQVEENTKEINPQAKAGWKTALAAGGAAALDSVVPAGIGKALVARLGAKAADRAAWQLLLAPADSKLGQALAVIAGTAKTATVESATEAGQQVAEAAGGSWEATGHITLPDDMLDQAINAGVGGFILGGAGGLVEHTGQPRVVPLPNAKPWVEKGDGTTLVAPTNGPVSHTGEEQTPLIPKGAITSKFGPRHSFMTNSGQMASSNHAGNDIVIPGGKKADIPAAVDGTVTYAGQKGGYGNYVVVTASDGTSFAYGHLSRIDVKVGDKVSQGEALGKQGATGNATGVHVHFERRDAHGRVVNSMTGAPVTTVVNDQGQVADDTGLRVKQTPFDESSYSQTEIDNNFEDATGQRFAKAEGPEAFHAPEPSPPSEAVQPEPLTAPGPATGTTASLSTEERRPIADRVAHIFGPSPAAETQAIADRLASDLDEAKNRNPAAIRLQQLQVPQGHDFGQPLPGEEPVFDETQSQVVAFHHPDTGAVRAIGEPPADLPVDQLAPETPAEAPQSTIPQMQVTDAGTTEQLPYEAPAQPEAAPAAPVPAEPVPAAQPEQAPPLAQLPQIVHDAPQLAPENSPQEEPTVGAVTPETPAIPAKEIDRTLTKIDDKLFDLENEGTKSQAKRYAQGLVKQGILDQRDVDALSHIVSDRDMSVEDVTSEIRSSVAVWEDTQRGVSRPQVADAFTRRIAATGADRAAVRRAIEERRNAAAERYRQGGGVSEAGDTGRTGSADQGEPVTRPPTDENGNVTLDHWTLEQGLTRTDPDLWGRSGNFLPEEERSRMGVAPGRTYFGIATGQKGGYVNEFQSGEHPRFEAPVHRVQAKVQLAQLYDMDADPDGLKAMGRALPKNPNGRYIYGDINLSPTIPGIDGVSLYEQLIKDAGYAGYWTNSRLGLVAAVFDPVDVSVARPQPAARPEAPSSREQGRQRSQARTDAKAYKQSVLDKVHTIYKEMGLQGLVPVEVVNRLFSPSGQEYRGVFDADMVIRIAAFEQGVPVNDASLRGVARHEVVHWAVANNVWTPAQWKLLKGWAQAQPELMAWARENYPKPQWTEEDILEEAVAEGFSRWDNGRLQAQHKMPPTLTQKILQKLKDIAAHLRAAFTAAGITPGEFNEATRLLAEFENGRHVAKLKQAQRPTFGRNIRSDSLSYELLTNSITPDQHWFLSRFKGGKFQSAWHGSPKEDIDKFSLEYIGTGEGAQAFGWGLYFAQKKDVADWYRRKLTMNTKDPVDVIMEVNGRPIREWIGERFGQGFGIAQYEVADRMFSFLTTNRPYNGWLDALHARVDNDIAGWLDAARKEGNSEEEQDLLAVQSKISQVFVALSGQKITQKQYPLGGKTYRVEVPEDDQLLDLDKKLSDQPEQVRKSLAKIKADLEKAGVLDEYEEQMNAPFEDWTGLELVRPIARRMAYDDVFPSTSEELENAFASNHVGMATSIYLRDCGIPGSRYLDRDSRIPVEPGQPKTANFVIFDDDLITLRGKYRVVDGTPANSPLSDPSKPDPGMIRKIHDNTMGMLTKLASLGGGSEDWDKADNILDAWRRKMTQKYQQVLKTQRRAEKLLGVDRMAPDANPMDMITADERGYKLNVVNDNMLRPMLHELHNRGLTMSDLGLYLYARHAPHRNARIAKINKEFKDPNVNPGSGMTDDEAAKIMADFASQGKTTDLANAAQYIDNMIEYAQQERLTAGLLTTADIAAGFQPDEFYVPLRGHDEAEPEFEIDMPLAGGRRGGGFSVAGKEGHRMFGRASKADLEEIVGYVITQTQDSIDRAFRNRVAQSMANLFRTVPDPNFVKIDRVKRVAVWNKKTGKVEYQMQTRITDPKEQQRTIFFKENGTVHKMTFNEHNLSALRFVKAAKNLGVADIGRGLRFLSLYTRIFTKANTQWNLDFVLANAAKDIQTAVVNASTLDVKGLRWAIIRNVLSGGALRGAWWGVHQPAGAGFGTMKIWREMYAEFEANGGKLDYGQTGPVQDAIRLAKGDLKNMARHPMNPVKAVRVVGGWIDKSASAFENMTRLAAYKALRDAGIPPKQAAVAVRQLTTNFQQHGEWGPKINAAYGFANATIIGGARFTQTVVKKPQIGAAIIGVAMLADFLNHLWDPDKWDRYDEETKDREFLILLPDWMGFNINIPAGYGINTMATVGRKMSELWRGKKNADGSKMSVADAMGDVFQSAINAFSPVPGHSFLNILAPSALDPFVDLFQNEDNWGHRIYPQGSDRPGYIKPNSQLVRDQTGAFWRGLAEGLNKLGGGNEVIPGFPALDHSPESYKYLAGQIGGGAARTVGRVVGLAEDVATGQAPALNDIPVVRRFAGKPYGAAGAADEEVSVFYDHFNTGQETLGTAKRMMERYGKHSPEYAEWRKEHEPVIDFHKNIEAAGKHVNAYSAAESDLRRAHDAAEGLDKEHRHAIYRVTKIPVPKRKLTDAEFKRQMDAIKLKRQHLAERFNQDWLQKVMGEVE